MFFCENMKLRCEKTIIIIIAYNLDNFIPHITNHTRSRIVFIIKIKLYYLCGSWPSTIVLHIIEQYELKW
jgi:hypothetical protein